MSDLVVTPSDVLTHLSATDAAVATLDAAFAACPALDDTKHAAWLNFRSDYTSFSTSRRKRWTGTLAAALLVLNPGLNELDLRADDAKILDYEHQIAGWQSIAKASCGLSVPGLTPRDDPSTPGAQLSKTVEHVAIAGAVIVVGVVGLVGFNYLRRLF
jgi:hypothetical protein